MADNTTNVVAMDKLLDERQLDSYLKVVTLILLNDCFP